jgi:uncharacterized protein YxeA
MKMPPVSDFNKIKIITVQCVRNSVLATVTSLIFYFMLLIAITVFLLCCLSLCCFLIKLQTLFYHRFTNFIKIHDETQKTTKVKHNLE